MHNTGKELRSTEDVLYITGWGIVPAFFLCRLVLLNWIIPNLPPSECLFLKFFGIYCPGCGGTRALITFLHGEFFRSFCFHPFIMYVFVMYMWFMISHTLEKLHVPYIKGLLFKEWILYGSLVVLAVNFVIKNILKIAFGYEMGVL